MKRGYIFLLAFLLSFSARSQDSTATEPVELTCEDVAFDYCDLLMDYYSRYSDDSLRNTMAEWEQNCGMPEQLLSFKLLYAIEKGEFSEALYDTSISQYLVTHVENAEYASNYLSRTPVEYYAYLRAIAKSLQKLELTPLEKTIADFYAARDEDVLEDMDTTLSNTILYTSYKAYEAEKYRIFGRFHIAAYAGAWIPDGKIGVLGSHPLIGFQLGSEWNKLSFNFSMAFRFINAPREYQVYHYGNIQNTKYHTGLYAGIDAGYRFAEMGKSKMYVLGGIGYDAITVLKATSEEANDAKFLSSVNLNGGLGYKYYFKKRQYVGLMGKYNLLFFKNKSGTSLEGNAVTIALVYGFH